MRASAMFPAGSPHFAASSTPPTTRPAVTGRRSRATSSARDRARRQRRGARSRCAAFIRAFHHERAGRFPAVPWARCRPKRSRAELKRLPAGPGVYLFRDERDDVLYVGKAKSLRSRVRQYFQAGRSDNRLGIDTLVERVDRIETIVTGSEVEALHLEQNLVKRHRPPFNVRLRDDKSFPYIAVTLEDDYPRVMFTRKRHRRGVLYFGPYANAKKVRETLDVLNRVFRYRPCEGPKPGRRSGIPCLDYHIERCLAPCVGYVSKEAYREVIDGVIEFLSGNDKPIRAELERQMREAAAEERFEDAARYRNRLHAVERLAERQAVERASIGTIDVIGLAVGARAGGGAGLPAARRPDGRPLLVPPRERGRRRPARGARGLLPRVLRRGAVDAAADPRPARPRRPRRRSRASCPSCAARGSRCARPSAARSGACRSSRSRTPSSRSPRETLVAETKRLRRVEALEELREVLNLESLPIRIECFDISNIQGQEIVGSMVVFEDGVAKKAHYRKFAVRGQAGQDDFAAMAEVVVAPVRTARGRAGGRRLRRVVRRDAEPGRDRRRQGPARRRARGDGGLRPAAGRGDLAREAGRGGLPARPAGPGAAARPLARAAAAAAAPRRGAPVRDHLPPLAARRGGPRVDVRPARRRRPGRGAGRSCATSARPSVSLAASAEELEGVPGVPAKTARHIYAQLHRAGRA